MKVTCTLCKRRVKVRPGFPYTCKCGEVIDVFPKGRYLERFRALDYDAIRELRESFFNGNSPDWKREILELLLDSSEDRSAKKIGLLVSIEILRQTKGASFIDLAWALVARYPRDFYIRFMLANCLDLTDDRNNHIEALKQRMIGTTIKCLRKKRHDQLNGETYRAILKRHLDSLHSERSFLMGITDHSCEKVHQIAMKQYRVDQDLMPMISELENVWQRAGLLQPAEVAGKRKCVLDTNAFSDISASRHFRNPHVQFMAPLSVLIELSRWCEIDRFPLEMEWVTFKEVSSKIPPEIDTMFSRFKGKEPSETDKRVATLAFEERADAIVSSDRDLWDSGLPQRLEKNYGVSLKVVKPTELGRWIEKNT